MDQDLQGLPFVLREEAQLARAGARQVEPGLYEAAADRIDQLAAALEETEAKPALKHWTEDVPAWNHPVPASTPENAAKVMAVPGLRAVYHAMNHVASHEEGLCSVANGLATALGCQRKMWTNLARDFPDSEFTRMTVDQSEIGYYMGLQLLSSAFGFFDDGGDLGDPVEGYHDTWPYGETPEESISRWVEARNKSESPTNREAAQL